MRTSTRPTRHRGAFTLVELLVVIGIIALLIAILLPTVRKAYQAAQNAQCLSNLRQIGQAQQMYRQDTGRLPFFFIFRTSSWGPIPQNGTGGTIWWTSFSQGGRTTHPSITIGYMDEGDKPLNKYLYKNVYSGTWDGTRAAADGRPPRDVFKCPADDGNGMSNNRIGVPFNYLGTSVPSPYDLYGTNYMMNRGWMYDTEIVNEAWRVLGSGPLTHDKVNGLNRYVTKVMSKWIASETYAAVDLQFIWSVFYHVQMPGAHTNQPYHNAVFLDGHAKPVYVTQHDVNSWGGRIPGRYIPKYGEGWREARNPYPQGAGAPSSKGVPWSATDPMGIGPRQFSTQG